MHEVATTDAIEPCPLCQGTRVGLFNQDRWRDYYQCHTCCLVFVPAEQRLPPEQEKARYDLHENAVDDPGYRRFLARLYEPLTTRLPARGAGLDFGCGPAPALAAMLREGGWRVDVYDPFYCPDPEPLSRYYDFVTCTEVVEHLFRPGQVLPWLMSRLRPGGWLGIMTKLVIDQAAFRHWHYKNDMTHVCFFSRATFRWLAVYHGWRLCFVDQDVILMRARRGRWSVKPRQ